MNFNLFSFKQIERSGNQNRSRLNLKLKKATLSRDSYLFDICLFIKELDPYRGGVAIAKVIKKFVQRMPHDFSDRSCTLELTRSKGLINVQFVSEYYCPQQELRTIPNKTPETHFISTPTITVIRIFVQWNKLITKRNHQSLEPEVRG